MNERIGTFCEKCREVVCRCAENEANLKKATDNVVRSKPSDSFNHWVEFLLGDSEESVKMKEEPISSEEKYYIMEKAEKPNTWVVHTKLVKDIPVTDEVLIEHLKKIQCKKGYLDSNDVCLKDVSNSDSDYKFIATWWDEPTALANSEYRLTEESERANVTYEINPEFAEVFKEPCGWAIEWNISSTYYDKEGKQQWTGHTHWSRHWKHKLYESKETCLKAIERMRDVEGNQYHNIKFRIFPVYQGKIEEV